jgi:S-DNA-T family DNA segregation ATPase FtsK/SpoIIIE
MKWFKRWFSKEKQVDQSSDSEIEESIDDQIIEVKEQYTDAPSELVLETDIKTIMPEQHDEKQVQPEYSELPTYNPSVDLQDYKYPSLDLLETYIQDDGEQIALELEAKKNKILSTLKDFGISVTKISATEGPAITLFEIVPIVGERIGRIKKLDGEIALALSALMYILKSFLQEELLESK